MPRVIWKGSISFGLVHVPVGLYSAEKREELNLTLLDSRNLSPVGYKRINKGTGEEVPWDVIVKGYEYEKGEYVLLGEEDLRRANVKATQTVEIIDFVDRDAIPLIYYDKPYFLEPIQRGEKGYALLRETLHRSNRVGIAKVVLRTRQYLAALVPMGAMMVLNLLRYPTELRDVAEFSVPGEDLDGLGISDREIEMAQRLVEDMVVPWQPEKYRDEYREDLLHFVEEKVRSGETHVIHEAPAEEPRVAEVIDLMSLLKKSVEETEKSRGKAAAPPAKKGRKPPKRA